MMAVMTTQIPDEVWFQNAWYAIAAIEGTALFDPAEHGVRPGPKSTACWRGFQCWYRIYEGALLLDKVEMGRPEGRVPMRKLFGAKALRGPDTTVLYRGLAAPMSFTGRLLIGDGHQGSGYLNMGFTPAWRYETVYEIVFDSGRMSAAYDRSAELAAVAERLGTHGLRPRENEPTLDWIRRTSSLSFAYSWPAVP